MLYAFFWVILHNYLPMKTEQTECSETSAYEIQTSGNYPEGSIKQVEMLFPVCCIGCYRAHTDSMIFSLYCDWVVLTGTGWMPEEFLARAKGSVDTGGSFLLDEAAGA